MSAADIDLLQRLIKAAEVLTEDRRVNIGDEHLRQLKSEVAAALARPLGDAAPVIDYQAACLMQVVSEIAYARSDRGDDRESRAICYANCLLTFMRNDLARLQNEVRS